MLLCENPECCLECEHDGECAGAESMAFSCICCGAKLDTDEVRWVLLKPRDRRFECSDCWARRVLEGQPPIGKVRDTIPVEPPTEPSIGILPDLDDAEGWS